MYTIVHSINLKKYYDTNQTVNENNNSIIHYKRLLYITLVSRCYDLTAILFGNLSDKINRLLTSVESDLRKFQTFQKSPD